jgi:hypothetical protein
MTQLRASMRVDIPLLIPALLDGHRPLLCVLVPQEAEMPTTGINLTKLGWHGVYNLSLSMNNIDSYQKCHRQRTKSVDPQDVEYCVYTLSGGILEDSPLLTASE